MIKLRHRADRGFTLIEVLVAVFILVIIVLILSEVYHQCSICWSAGVRKARGNMSARAAVGFMARELLNAVADPEILNDIYMGDGLNSIQFITLTGDPVSAKRAAKRIRYAKNGNTLEREERTAATGSYGAWGNATTWVLVTNVDDVVFYTSDGGLYDYGGLPSWVRIRLTINTEDDVSGVGASSWGPDGQANTSDDIHSY